MILVGGVVSQQVYYIQTRGVVWVWWAESTDITGFLDSAQEVLSRAVQTLEWAKTQRILLDIALDHLSLGRAYICQALQEGSQDFTQAKEHLNQTVDGLRQAGTQHEVPRGLLARG